MWIILCAIASVNNNNNHHEQKKHTENPPEKEKNGKKKNFIFKRRFSYKFFVVGWFVNIKKKIKKLNWNFIQIDDRERSIFFLLLFIQSLYNISLHTYIYVGFCCCCCRNEKAIYSRCTFTKRRKFYNKIKKK